MASSNADTEANGFVSVQQIDDVWWFTGPDGEPFVTLGVNHLELHPWLTPYNQEETLDRYGEDMVTFDSFNPYGDAAKRWVQNIIDLSKDLGFNSFGKHVHVQIPDDYYTDDIYYVKTMSSLATRYAPVAWYKQKFEYGPFPDPFSNEFERKLAFRVEEVCREHRSEENLLGYYLEDLTWWQLREDEQQEYDEDVFIYPWVHSLVQRDPDAAGKQRWIEILRDRYDSTADTAEVYGLDAQSWDELAKTTDWFDPEDPERAREDCLDLNKDIAEKWYGLHHDYIREHDENHLILGDKQNFVPEWLMPILGKYVDVNVIQKYEPFEAHREMVEKLYEVTGNPVMNGDGSFSTIRPEQTEHGCKGYHFDTEEEVAEAHREYVRDIMAEPYMLGWHVCGIMEQWDEAPRGDITTSETGFLDPFENEYEPLTDAIEEANSQAEQWHRAAASDGGGSDD